MSSNTSESDGLFRGILRAITGSNEPKPMKINKLSETYSVSGQLTFEDLVEVKAAGFKTVMCNRPDGESAGQPTASEMKTAATKLGLNFFYVPLGRGGINKNIMIDFKKAVAAKNGPVLAYCRSGNRCTMLWNAHQG